MRTFILSLLASCLGSTAASAHAGDHHTYGVLEALIHFFSQPIHSAGVLLAVAVCAGFAVRHRRRVGVETQRNIHKK